MYKKDVIFSSFLLCLAVIQIKADLTDKFCNVAANSQITPQVISQGSKIASERPLNEYVLKTQTFQLQTKSYFLKYIQNQGNLIMESIDEKLSIRKFVQTVDNDLIYLDSINQFMVAKQIVNYEKGLFNYVIFKANMLSVENTLTKVPLSSKLNILSFHKILQITETHIYIMFITDLNFGKKGIIYKINLLNGDNFQIYSYLDSATETKLNIIAGNLKYLYDQTSGQFYQKDDAEWRGLRKYQVKSIEKLGLSSSLSENNLNFIQLNKQFIVFSFANGKTNMINFPSNDLVNPSNVISIIGDKIATIRTDNWKNLVAVTNNDLAWIQRDSDSKISSKKMQDTGLNSTQKYVLIKYYSTNQLISFNKDHSLIINKNQVGIFNIFLSIKFNSNLKPYITKIDQIPFNPKDLTQIDSSKGNFDYKSSITCSCISTTVQKLVCDGASYKCFAITSSDSVDCTKSV